MDCLFDLGFRPEKWRMLLAERGKKRLHSDPSIWQEAGL